MCIVDGVSQSCFHDNFNLLLNLKLQLIEEKISSINVGALTMSLLMLCILDKYFNF